MRFTTIAWRNLLRRPTRTLLTILGLSIAVAAIVALVGISDGFESSYVDLFHDRQVDLIVQRASTGSHLNRLLDPKLKDALEQSPGVKEVFPGQMDLVSFPEYDLSLVITVGWDPASRLMKRLTITSGGPLRPGDHNKAIIGTMLANSTGKRPGDMLSMYGEQIEVVGIFESHSVFENGGVYMPIGELQRLMNTRLVTAFSISVDRPDDPAAVDAVARRIEEMDPSLLALPATDFVASIQQIRLARGVAWAVSAIALVIGAIGMLNTMVMSVAERVGEIATLRAIGWTRWRVISVILCEAILLSIAGAVVGVLAAIALAQFLSGFRLTSGVIQGQIAPAVMVQGVLVALLVGVGGAVYPAFWGASQRPTEAMRRK